MILYNLGIFIYWLGIYIAHFFNSKAKQFIDGRSGVFDMLKEKVDLNSKYVWVHAASLGEFEQGRPIIERIKREHPELKVILTFFSPSGYEVRKNYDVADIVCYMPMDTWFNARKFLKLVPLHSAIFVKYEFWLCFLNALHSKKIPTYIVSAIFREEQLFFKWYGKWYASFLKRFNRLFVQDSNSVQLLKSVNVENVTVVGDTRFDRVAEIASQCNDLPIVEAFKGDKLVLIAGSSWEPDENLLCEYFQNHDIKMILAPHVTSEDHVQQICKKLEGKKYVRYTKTNPDEAKNADCLIIDCIGILTSVYKYGNIGYVGGGFGVGIHNTLEPAVYGMPIFFGPNYKRFREAVEMVNAGVAHPIENKETLFPLLDEMFDPSCSTLANNSAEARKFVQQNCGATEIVMKEIFG